jgi:hypothetical protein
MTTERVREVAPHGVVREAPDGSKWFLATAIEAGREWQAAVEAVHGKGVIFYLSPEQVAQLLAQEPRVEYLCSCGEWYPEEHFHSILNREKRVIDEHADLRRLIDSLAERGKG